VFFFRLRRLFPLNSFPLFTGPIRLVKASLNLSLPTPVFLGCQVFASQNEPPASCKVEALTFLSWISSDGFSHATCFSLNRSPLLPPVSSLKCFGGFAAHRRPQRRFAPTFLDQGFPPFSPIATSPGATICQNRTPAKFSSAITRPDLGCNTCSLPYPVPRASRELISSTSSRPPPHFTSLFAHIRTFFSTQEVNRRGIPLLTPLGGSKFVGFAPHCNLGAPKSFRYPPTYSRVSAFSAGRDAIREVPPQLPGATILLNPEARPAPVSEIPNAPANQSSRLLNSSPGNPLPSLSVFYISTPFSPTSSRTWILEIRTSFFQLATRVFFSLTKDFFPDTPPRTPDPPSSLQTPNLLMSIGTGPEGLCQHQICVSTASLHFHVFLLAC